MFDGSEKSDGCILDAYDLLVTGNGYEENGRKEVARYC